MSGGQRPLLLAPEVVELREVSGIHKCVSWVSGGQGPLLHAPEVVELKEVSGTQ